MDERAEPGAAGTGGAQERVTLKTKLSSESIDKPVNPQ